MVLRKMTVIASTITFFCSILVLAIGLSLKNKSISTFYDIGYSVDGLHFCSFVVLFFSIFQKIAVVHEYYKTSIIFHIIGIAGLFYLAVKNIIFQQYEQKVKKLMVKYHSNYELNIKTGYSNHHTLAAALAILNIVAFATTVYFVFRAINKNKEAASNHVLFDNENTNDTDNNRDSLAMDKRTNSNLVAMNDWLPSEPVENSTVSTHEIATIENSPQPNTVSDVQHSQNLEGELSSPSHQNFEENLQNSEDFSPPPYYKRQP